MPPSAVPILGQQGDFLYVDNKITVEHIKRQYRANQEAITALYYGSMSVQRTVMELSIHEPYMRMR